MDGGSTDGTVDILGRYQKLVWVSETDDGQAAALNKGFKRATGDIIGWLNADDVYLPGALHDVATYFSEHSDIDFIHGDIDWIDADGNRVRTVKGREFDFSEALIANPVNQQAAFFRRNSLEKVGYLREDLHFTMDYEFWLRLGRQVRGRYMPQLWAQFRMVPGTKSYSKPHKFWLEVLDIYGEVFSDPVLEPSVKAIEQHVYARMHWLAGLSLCRSGDFEGGSKHCRKALMDHELLTLHPNLAAESLVYTEADEWREPTEPAWIEPLLNSFADDSPEMRRLKRRGRATFYATRFFHQHWLGEQEMARRSAMMALRYGLAWLVNRGFAIRLLEVTAGNGIANLSRRLV